MQRYKQTKKFFYRNVVLIILVLTFGIFLGFKVLHSEQLKYTTLFLDTGIGIYSIWIAKKSYQSPMLLNNEKIVVASMGREYNINYHEIVSIQYREYPNFLLCDTLILNCGMQGKIGIFAAYDDSVEVWRQIISNAKAVKPNIVIEDRVNKRLNRG